jgi:hypothetical protein
MRFVPKKFKLMLVLLVGCVVVPFEVSAASVCTDKTTWPQGCTCTVVNGKAVWKPGASQCGAA